jgi:excinuclease UvrABC ATPase subunit
VPDSSGGSSLFNVAAAGTPEQVMSVPESYTDEWLKRVLNGK